MKQILAWGLAAALLGCVILGGLFLYQLDKVDDLREENRSLTASVKTLTWARDQAKMAARIAQEEAERQRIAALEYEQVKEAFRKGDFNVPLPDDFRVLLNRVLRPKAN